MRRHIGFLGSILLGAVIVTMGVSGNLALAQSVDAAGNKLRVLTEKIDKEVEKVDKIKPCNADKKCASVPEPASLILLGAGLAGLGIWSWRKKTTKV